MAKPKDIQEDAKNSKKIDIETPDKKTNKPKADKMPDEKAKTTEEKKNSVADRNGQDKAGDDLPEAAQTAEEKLADLNDKYLRLAAEYDNFRKRNAKERESTYGNAKADVVNRLLPVYDNLERALKMECSDEAYFKGIEMTMQQLTEILKDMGVLPIPTVGEPFDPNRHEAVARIDSPDTSGGKIIEECKKGFSMGERVIRFSQVVVAN